MELFLIIFLIVLGLVFIFVELFFIPGTAFVGFLGFLIMCGGIFLTYSNYSNTIGNLVLILSLVSLLILVLVGFNRIKNMKWAVTKNIDSKVNKLDDYNVEVGESGYAFNTLRPNGSAMINGERVEVFSYGEYIEKGTKLEIVKITQDRIYVNPIK
jgi:membrane-bound ClpP family serine protease